MTYMKFKIWIHPSLVIITTYLVYLTYEERGVEKKIFKEIMHFHYMTYIGHAPAQEPLPLGS